MPCICRTRQLRSSGAEGPTDSCCALQMPGSQTRPLSYLDLASASSSPCRRRVRSELSARSFVELHVHHASERRCRRLEKGSSWLAAETAGTAHQCFISLRLRRGLLRHVEPAAQLRPSSLFGRGKSGTGAGRQRRGGGARLEPRDGAADDSRRRVSLTESCDLHKRTCPSDGGPQVSPSESPRNDGCRCCEPVLA